MLRIFIIALCYMHVTGCAHSDPWTKTDTALYMGYVGTLAYDAHTTSEIRHYPCLQESGPIAKQVLGLQPDAAATWQYMGTLAITNYFIARSLPSTWRKVWLGANGIEHGSAAFNNDKLFDRGC